VLLISRWYCCSIDQLNSSSRMSTTPAHDGLEHSLRQILAPCLTRARPFEEQPPTDRSHLVALPDNGPMSPARQASGTTRSIALPQARHGLQPPFPSTMPQSAQHQPSPHGPKSINKHNVPPATSRNTGTRRFFAWIQNPSSNTAIFAMIYQPTSSPPALLSPHNAPYQKMSCMPKVM
jgi:hypothetical protein